MIAIHVVNTKVHTGLNCSHSVRTNNKGRKGREVCKISCLKTNDPFQSLPSQLGAVFRGRIEISLLQFMIHLKKHYIFS